MDRELINYLPDILKHINEFKQIMKSEQPEIDRFWSESNNYVNNSFVLTQDANTASRWEKILHIASKDTDELDVRNFKILSVMQGKLPYTYRVLYKTLLAMIKDKNDFKLEVDNEKYFVKITVALSSGELRDEIEKLADRIVPANMLLSVSLWYTTHKMLEKKTYGSLETYTHEELTRLDLR